ncbi:unnamed protein product, partial [Meganyctiphanes norvegica]
MGVAIEGMREDMNRFMANAITTFGALFSTMAGPNLEEFASMHHREDNDILKKSLEEGKNVAAIRAVRFRDALLRNEDLRNGPKPSGTPNTSAQAGPRSAHRNNQRPTIIGDNRNNQNNITNSNSNTARNNSDNTINNIGTTAPTDAVAIGPRTTQQPDVRPNPGEEAGEDAVDRMSEQQRIWKKIVDERRKNNIIIMGLTETGIREEDEEAVRHLLRYINCGNRFDQITNMRRLGNRASKRRLLLVNFDNDFAVKQILDRSPKLSRSALFGRVHIKKDLPFEDRPVYVRNDRRIADSANGAP